MIHPSDMKHGLLRALVLLSVPTLATATPSGQSAIDVCRIAAAPENWIGAKVRVEGYVIDLSSHGFVLVSGRGCTGHGQLGLLTNSVDGAPTWRSAFGKSSGPKRAVLIGRVRWTRAQMGGRNAALVVLQVESIADREAHLDELS